MFGREQLKINIKRLRGDSRLSEFTVKPCDNIQEFIDEKLFEIYGKKSDDLFLVYTGKQMDMELSFEEEFVENQSELICVSLEDDYTGGNMDSVHSLSPLKTRYSRQKEE